MNRNVPLVFLGLIILAGCGRSGGSTVVGADGSRVTSSSDGTKVTATSPTGDHVEVNSGANGEVNGSQVTADGKKTTYSVGGATETTEDDLGLPFYPGAKKRPEDSDTKIDVDGKKSMMATRFTTDDVMKVSSFYAGKVSVKNKFESADIAVLSGENPKGEFAINISKVDGGTLIVMTVSPK